MLCVDSTTTPLTFCPVLQIVLLLGLGNTLTELCPVLYASIDSFSAVTMCNSGLLLIALLRGVRITGKG